MAQGYDRFAIVPLNSGLENNVKPFLIADDAYATMNNAYLWRGRVRKRFGSRLLNTSVPIAQQPLLSRLRINIGTTDGGGHFTTTVPGGMGAVGQMFSIGNILYTVINSGFAAMLVTNNPVSTGNFNTTTGLVNVFNAPALTAVYWYPSLPVMGLLTWDEAGLTYLPVIGFDTQFAYQYTSAGWVRLGTAIWTGSDSQFFWAANYRGALPNTNLLYVTNNNAPDGIKYWDGATWTTQTWVIDNLGSTILTTLMIIPFQDRLLFLSPTINVSGMNQTFQNQVNWSVASGIGPTDNPTDPNAFNIQTPGKGGFLIAPTQEPIVTAQVIRNRLIVMFLYSTWEFVYTGNQVQPFRWQSINIELGAQSTFSHIPFDKFILGIGNQGVQRCDGVNVQRIDDKIPDEVINIQNANNGQQRVYGIRDYSFEMVYWAMPMSDETIPVYPNRVMVYNYKTGTWAFNDDSITCFGYFQQQPADTWQTDTGTWEDDDTLWQTGSTQSNVSEIIAGNQEGFTFIIDGNENSNAPSLQITNITIPSPNLSQLTVINHNLQQGDFVLVLSAVGNTSLNGNIYKVQVIDPNTINVIQLGTTGVYLGQGTLSRVSRINIRTKQYNFYMKEARNCFVAKVDFLVDATVAGAFTVDTFVSSADGTSLIDNGQETGALVGTGVLKTSPYALAPLEQSQSRFWHPIFLQAEGECVQLKIYFSDAQMVNTDIVTSDFQINAMVFWTLRTSIGFTSG